MGFIPNQCHPRINPTRSVDHYRCFRCLLHCSNINPRLRSVEGGWVGGVFGPTVEKLVYEMI